MRILLAALLFLGGFHGGYANTAQAAQALCSMNDGKTADGEHALEQQGKKYQFCCAGCLQEFKKSPEKFAEDWPVSASHEMSGAESTCSTVCSD